MKNSRFFDITSFLGLVAAAALCCSIPRTTQAAGNDTWTGLGPDANWTDATNWMGTNVPAAGDWLFFDGSTQTSPNNDFTAGTAFENITFNAGAGSFTLGGNQVRLLYAADSGGGTVSGGSISNASANAQTVSLPLDIDGGLHYVFVGDGETLNLNGAITHNSDTAVIFSTNGTVNVTGSGLANDSSDNGGILGGWATIGGDWAALDGSGNVVPYAGYTNVQGGDVISSDAASNVRITNNGANITLSDPTTYINSLIYATGAGNQTVDTGGGTLVLGQNGGIFSATAANGSGTHTLQIGTSTAAGGILTAGDGVNPATIYLDGAPVSSTSGILTLDSAVQDNGSAPVSLVILGGYMNINGVNTHSGGTYILQGRASQASQNTWGTGPVYIFPGGHANTGSSATNDFYLAGVGSIESAGLGTLRLYNNITLSGTITLMEDAAIGCHQGTVNTLSGKITGPGGLTACHGANANGAGTLQIGAASGSAVANDYAGDTTVQAVSSGTRPSVLKITAAADNNIMPHGSTGSYSGGPTGNLILSALSSTLSATFDLNGSTQTINGLMNTTNSESDNIVQSAQAGGHLILGDNDATATFNGIIQNGAGTLALTKIGSGTQTLGGANTYTGDTIINGGSLVLGKFGSIAYSANISINTGGALDTSAAGTISIPSGGVFSMSNATLNVAVPAAGGSIVTPTLNVAGTSNVVNIARLPGADGYPVQFPVIQSGSPLNGMFNFSLGALPASSGTPYAGYLTNDTDNNSVDVVLTAGPLAIKWTGYASGSVTPNWDDSTMDWSAGGTPAAYSDGSFVGFDDSASNSTVTLLQDVSPASVSFSNNVLNYTINDGNAGYAITGSGSFLKQGSGTVVLDNAGGMTLSGGVVIGGGTLQVGNSDANGSLPPGNITDNGTLAFNRNDSSLTVANAIIGSGSLAINDGTGTVTLSGANTFSGDVTVASGGVLQAGSGSALGTSDGGTTISNGAALDVNGHNLGAEVVTAGGTGTDSGAANGAIYNSGGTAATALANVTLSGDTTIGGSGNWNLSGGTFSTGGNAYNLTKAGANQIGLVGESVDAALGDVDVQGGTLSVETTTDLGNTASNLYVRSGATLRLNNLANPLDKQIQLDDGATIYTAGGNDTISGSVTLGGNATIDGAGASVLTLNNTLGGSGNLYKNGTNTTLVLDESDSSAVSIQVNGGVLILNGDRSNAGSILYTVDGTTSVGGNGTNAGPVYIGGLLEPGIGGNPSTFGAASLGMGTYGGAPEAIFNLSSSTTVGGGVNDLLNVAGELDPGGNSIIIRPLGLLSTAGSYTLAQYGLLSASPFSGNVKVDPSFGPARYQFSLTQGSGLVQLTVTTGPGNLEWNDAAGTGIWDVTNAFNWYNTVGATNDYFAPLDTVTFDDSIIASGAANVVSIVAGGVTPSVVTVDSTTNYVINGPGKISGFASIVKSGSSTLTLNAANDFTGDVTVSGGTLLLGDNTALGSTDGATIITNGGTVDFGSTAANNINIGAEPVYVSGWGVNSNGAIINSSGSGSYPGGNGNLLHITLQGDTAIGGSGRMDLRAAGATLSSGGQPYALVFMNSNSFNMSGVDVDPALGDVDIRAGLTGIQGDMGMGNVESNLTVYDGATLQLYDLTASNGLAKSLVLQDGASLHNAHGANLVSGPVTLSTNSLGGAGACYFTISSSGLTVSGVIGGAGSLVKTNGGSGLTLTTNDTYTGDTVIAQGTLTLAGNATIDNSTNIILGGGALNVSGRDDGTLTLSAGSLQTLSGSGTLTGILSSPANTTVAPGEDSTIGTLTVSSDAALSGMTVLKLDPVGNSSDEVASGGNVTIGGTLELTNISAYSMGGGGSQTFKVFNGSTYTTNYTDIEPATPGPNLAWDASGLGVDGTIKVVSTLASMPVVTGISVSGTSLTITATNGSPDGTYYLLESTNVSLPLSQWTPVLTNQYDGSGNVNVSTNIVNTADTQVFYILSNTNNQ